MVVKLLIVALFALVALNECILAVYCLRRHRSMRGAALVLLLLAPLQVVFLLFGERLLSLTHTPSSFDPLGDGFEIIALHVVLTGAQSLLAIGVTVYLASRLVHKAAS